MSFPPLMVGTWAWGEQAYWGYGGPTLGPAHVVDAFTAALEAGLTSFDTAEVYGHGESEKLLGWLARKSGRPVEVASKFALLPGRPGARVLRRALAASLARLRMESLDLYQIHWPDRAMATLDELAAALSEVVEAGLCRRVGVSNFSADEMKQTHEALQKRGLALASNQVKYSLLHRAPERDGVLEACRETGATLLAYSPLSQGVLTGKYHGSPAPPGRRGGEPWFTPEALASAAPLVERLREVGRAHGRTAAQVALRWLCDRPGVVPIVGLTSGEQASEAAGVATFTLSESERALLDSTAG